MNRNFTAIIVTSFILLLAFQNCAEETLNNNSTSSSSESDDRTIGALYFTSRPAGQYSLVASTNMTLNVSVNSQNPISYSWILISSTGQLIRVHTEQVFPFTANNIPGTYNYMVIATDSITQKEATSRFTIIVVTPNTPTTPNPTPGPNPGPSPGPSPPPPSDPNVPYVVTQPISYVEISYQQSRSDICVGATGLAPLYYTWHRKSGTDDSPVSGQNEACLSITKMDQSKIGEYYVVINNSTSTVTNSNSVFVSLKDFQNDDYLVNSQHKAIHCTGYTSLYGTIVYSNNGAAFCKFGRSCALNDINCLQKTSATCPSGWTQYKEDNQPYTETQITVAEKGYYAYINYDNDGGFTQTCSTTRSKTCYTYTNYHSFNNVAQESVKCGTTQRYYSSSGYKNCVGEVTTLATITSIGCF